MKVIKCQDRGSKPLKEGFITFPKRTGHHAMQGNRGKPGSAQVAADKRRVRVRVRVKQRPQPLLGCP